MATKSIFRLQKSVWNIARNFSTSRAVFEGYESPLCEAYYNDEQKELQRSFVKIIDTDINPFVDQWEEKEQFPSHDILKKLGNAGLLGIDRPTEYGGLGLGYKYVAAYLEEMGKINSGGVGTGLVAHTEICLPALSRFGSDELRKEFLAPSISGDYVACLGISEAHAGSDVANAKTTAKREGDDLVINGGKMWITNGMQADWMCCFANTNQGKKHANKSLVCVPLNAKGVSRTKIHKIGLHASDTAQIFFEDVRVPAKNIIGDEGAGFLYTMLQFQAERLGGCLAVLKGFDRAIGQTIDYTRQRQAFGKSVLDNQVVHHRLAELATEVEALRALIYRAVDMMNDGEDVTRLASMGKLKAGRLAREVADSCLQYWGGMGYARESLISRMFRDSRILSIYAGTDEIMLEIICKLMDIAPRPPKK